MTGAADHRPVVVGVDGSRSASGAVRVAAREATLRRAPLRLVMALPFAAGDDLPAPEGLDGRAVLRVAAELVIDGLETEIARSSPGVPVTSALVDGPAPEVLVAESADAGLVCVGTTSTGGLGDVLLGSTAGALARHALCPLLVVPLRLTTTVPEPSGVVVGLAGDDGDDALLAFALRAAADRGSAVVAVHTWRHTAPGLLHLGLEPLVDEVTAQHREEALLADVVDRAGPLPAQVHRVVRRGGAAGTLIAAGLTAELLVVGHRHDRGGHLRSVTSAVLHRAACPVAVLPLGTAVPPAARADRSA
ncbi:universal stress protein [Trujillonella endophytica]|uniref:Nucleotide-binding universal stress protein, UspA family n=1 Tax=Trujillonella endophytica TaxID=673521 RepID=A0A1H8T0J2_9ACTN|nr:universal stress protein [Trujillella endophytica]SEO84138.1 Nucleotide-binding universal stress protein, UspA family [Trujillella endophytica]